MKTNENLNAIQNRNKFPNKLNAKLFPKLSHFRSYDKTPMWLSLNTEHPDLFK